MRNKVLFFSLSLLISSLFLLNLPSLSYADTSDTLTISTYYPSPYGVYNRLQTNSLGVGDNNGNGTLDSGDVPTTHGDVWINGKVGIGTTNPGSKLSISAGATGQALSLIGAPGYWTAVINGNTHGLYAEGSSYGLSGQSSSGHGVYGHSNSGYGIYGQSDLNFGGYFYGYGGSYSANTLGYYLYGAYPGSAWGALTNGGVYAGYGGNTYGNVQLVTPSDPTIFRVNGASNGNYTAYIHNVGGSSHGLFIQSGDSSPGNIPLMVQNNYGWNLFYVRGDGAYYTYAGQISNKESKKNIKPFTESALDLLKDIQIITYNYKIDPEGRVERIGLIANDPNHIYDSRLTDNKTAFDTNSIVSVLIKATQEQQKIINDLKNLVCKDNLYDKVCE